MTATNLVTTREQNEFRAEVSAWMKENNPKDPGFLLPQTFMEVGDEQQLEFLRQYNISILYKNGLGVKKNPEEALNWLSKAAEGGYLNAQKRLADMYDKGEDVAKDLKQAHKWYLATALQGDVRAQRRLGFMYASGEGVSQDMAQGYMWLWVAAEAGDRVAKKSFDLLTDELEPEQIDSGKKLVTAWLDNRRATD